MPKRWALLTLCFALGITLLIPTTARAENSPTAVVASFQDALVEVMKDAQKLGVRGRYERLAPIVEKTFHIPTMSYMATSAATWDGSTPDQRKTLVRAFRRMSVSTLATLFNGYSGETFTAMGERDGPQNTRIVDTKLIKSDRSTNDISYIARNISGRWYLIDVIVDRGISEISVRRSEYNRVLQDRGLEGLIAVLEGKADELLAANPSAAR